MNKRIPATLHFCSEGNLINPNKVRKNETYSKTAPNAPTSIEILNHTSSSGGRVVVRDLSHGAISSIPVSLFIKMLTESCFQINLGEISSLKGFVYVRTPEGFIPLHIESSQYKKYLKEDETLEKNIQAKPLTQEVGGVYTDLQGYNFIFLGEVYQARAAYRSDFTPKKYYLYSNHSEYQEKRVKEIMLNSSTYFSYDKRVTKKKAIKKVKQLDFCLDKFIDFIHNRATKGSAHATTSKTKQLKL